MDDSSQAFEFASNPIRISPKIENRPYVNGVFYKLVVNPVWKALEQKAMKPSEMNGVNSGIQLERVDIRVKSIEEVAS
jgi:hypothetical protein